MTAITGLCFKQCFAWRDFPGEVIMDQAELQEQNDVTDHMIDYLGSPFRWGGFYFGPPYHLWRGPRPATGDPHCDYST